LIRIEDEKDQERALGVFLRVRAARVTFPGDIMGVTEEHIRALEQAHIRFQYVSKAPNGRETPPTVQS
jgi:hypothetical protein